MTIRHIQVFILVAKHLNIRKAAQEIGLSPSTVSKNIKSLENEIAVQLFVINSHSVELTPAGKNLLRFANTINTTYTNMSRDLQRHLQYKTRPLKVRSMYVMQHYGLANIFSSFEQENPSITMSISERPSIEIFAGVDNMDIDIGFIFMELIHEDKYNVIPLYTDSFAVLLNKAHPCASKQTVSLSEIEHTYAILLANDKLIFNFISENYSKIHKYGEKFDADMRLVTIKQYVKHIPEYITIIPNKMSHHLYDPDVIAVPLTDFPTVTLAMITRREPYPEIARQLMEYTTEFFRSLNSNNPINKEG